jgi:hypothetical protein
MTAALYGELSPHPWRDPDAATEDPYSLFYKRSLSMGWLDDVGTHVRFERDPATGRDVEVVLGETGAEGLWGMHEAGPEVPGCGAASPVAAWFQVGVNAVPPDRALPVQPFLRCADDVVARFGALRLLAVQMLLPVQQLLHTTPRPGLPSLSGSGWYFESDPRARTEVAVTVDSGQDPTVPEAADEMLKWLRRDDQDVFACDAYSLTDHTTLAESTPFHCGEWKDPPRHRVTFRGTLAEWSLEAVGGVAAVLADAGARHGVIAPVQFTAARADLPPDYQGVSSLPPPA